MSRFFPRLAVILFFLVSMQSHASDLDHKLAEQWRRYQITTSLGLSRLKEHRLPLTREEWEKSVSIAFEAEELKELKSRHGKRELEAKSRNEAASTLDLMRLRSLGTQRIQSFCAAMPKGGMLHVHPWGTVSRPAMTRIFQAVNPILTPAKWREALKDPTSLAYLYPQELDFLGQLSLRYGHSVAFAKLTHHEQASLQNLLFLTTGTHAFPRFQAVFYLIRELFLAHPGVDANSLMYDDFFSRAQASKVSYVELSELISLDSAATVRADRWAKDAQHDYGIVTRWLAAFLRTATPGDLAGEAAQVLALAPSKSIVGINLVADETATPALESAQTLYLPLLQAQRAGKTDLHSDIHAGELGDSRNVRDSLLMGAERIGHGVTMAADPVIVEYASSHHVPVEVNLTSNLRLRAVKDLSEHPFLHFLRLGLRVSLSTDDEGILGTDINHECEVAIEQSDVNYFELRQMILNSIETSFASEQDKALLLHKLTADLAAFEKGWKKPLGGLPSPAIKP